MSAARVPVSAEAIERLKAVVGRAGWSHLTNLGLTDLAAHNEAQFVEIATAWGHDLERLAGLRRALRSRMESSVLMNAAEFARGIEAAYRTIWHRWCDGGR